MCKVEPIIRNEFLGASVQPIDVHFRAFPEPRLHLALPEMQPEAEVIRLAPRRVPVARKIVLANGTEGSTAIVALPVETPEEAPRNRPARTRRQTAARAARRDILAIRRARVQHRLAAATRDADRPAHRYDPALMELDRVQDMRSALYPEVDPAEERRNRRNRLAARAMNAALCVVALPVGLALLVHSARRGEDLRLSSRLTAVTALCLAAVHQGLTGTLGTLPI